MTGGSSKPGNPNPHIGQTASKMHPAQKSGTKAGSKRFPHDTHKGRSVTQLPDLSITSYGNAPAVNDGKP